MARCWTSTVCVGSSATSQRRKPFTAIERPFETFRALPNGMVTYMRPDDDERHLLLSRLAGQRDHVLHQLDGLSDAQLRQPVLPSGWSCLGLVRHLTLSDERYWFEVVMAGGALDFWPEGRNGDWQVGVGPGPSNSARTRKPSGVPSGSLVRTTWRPRPARCCSRRTHCVDLPDPSTPSTVISTAGMGVL